MTGTRFPCQGCEERRPGCHGACERYAATAREQKKAREERESARRGYNEAYRLQRDSVMKTIRRSGGKKPW